MKRGSGKRGERLTDEGRCVNPNHRQSLSLSLPFALFQRKLTRAVLSDWERELADSLKFREGAPSSSSKSLIGATDYEVKSTWVIMRI